eukprot:5018440-Prorocentrum_lima.AAC.1
MIHYDPYKGATVGSTDINRDMFLYHNQEQAIDHIEYLGVPNVGEEGNIADLPASRGSGAATASGASS